MTCDLLFPLRQKNVNDLKSLGLYQSTVLMGTGSVLTVLVIQHCEEAYQEET